MGLLEAHAALAGRKAIVVGGAHGIGRAISLALADAGIAVAACDFDEEAASAIGAEVEAHGVECIAAHADVRDEAALERFFDRVEAEFETVDFLINVAGGVKSDLFTETTREQNASEIRLNYGYILDAVRRAVPMIRKGGRGGSIISFTTIEAHRGAASYSVYAGAKAATTNFSKALAVELAQEGIRVNLIAPDTTPSRTSFASASPEFMEKYLALPEEARAAGMSMYIPQKHPPSQEDLANAVLMLVSDLTRSITGITLHVDGGTMASAGFIDWPLDHKWGPAPGVETLAKLFAADGPPAA
ncbi:MAG: SDR family NAD(P)-dependent oxidoreductase [Novosphingobium sp.]|nr:SDR family NAD(P)-dependent oxidoreductase [Novosphingobium sp.]